MLPFELEIYINLIQHKIVEEKEAENREQERISKFGKW
jgi:hypothetical protein